MTRPNETVVGIPIDSKYCCMGAVFKIPANCTQAQDCVIKLRSDTFQRYQISPVEIIPLASTAFIEQIQVDDEVTQTT